MILLYFFFFGKKIKLKKYIESMYRKKIKQLHEKYYTYSVPYKTANVWNSISRINYELIITLIIIYATAKKRKQKQNNAMDLLWYNINCISCFKIIHSKLIESKIWEKYDK